MQQLCLTLPTPAENLALDEALLETAECDASAPQVLRLWEPKQPFVVLGRSSVLHAEVDVAYCRDHQIEIYRRASGGATIVAGPGCLMYAVVITYDEQPELRMLDQAHHFVMSRIEQAVSHLGLEVARAGTCDLIWQGKKFSGNSLRCRRNHFLYHGTVLYDFDLSLIESCLRMPNRQPEYRQGRKHGEFVTQIPANRTAIERQLIEVWAAHRRLENWPREMTAQLATEKYGTREWTEKL